MFNQAAFNYQFASSRSKQKIGALSFFVCLTQRVVGR